MSQAIEDEATIIRSTITMPMPWMGFLGDKSPLNRNQQNFCVDYSCFRLPLSLHLHNLFSFTSQSTPEGIAVWIFCRVRR